MKDESQMTNTQASSFLPHPFEVHSTQSPKIPRRICAPVAHFGNLLINIPGLASFAPLSHFLAHSLCKLFVLISSAQDLLLQKLKL